ncbi:hypothetical protein UP09_04850 [Bradyrhizobium sp. LTSP885]|uniref:hypothetical protein n=1 Tax=Bradyrhizobium sp. LTSP885 TaxID=1619232 RepID=UPI0005CA4B41|nr:hypothetical protein [Bradyrhizobium sp. LTSP885]KJC50372.1 hypothetical protein UP09_04850 [Bradyrhizobium sp. LTSP885]
MAFLPEEPPMEDVVAGLRNAGIDTDAFERRLKRTRDVAESIQATVTSNDSGKLLDAAVRGTFLPSDLGFAADEGGSSGPDLKELLAQSEVVPSQGRQMWQLKSAVRQRVLTQAQSNALQTATDMAPDPADPEGSMLRQVLKGTVPEQGTLSTPELQTLATVSDWLAGTQLAPMPPSGDIRREIAKRELLDPFRLLVGRSLEDGADGHNDRILGRDKQTEDLRAYVGIVPPEQLKDYVTRTFHSLWQKVSSSDTSNEPLIVEGIGGIGKSSLVAKFILDHALFPGLDFPFAYLDFDRAALAPREPMQLLIDIAVQFGTWFPQIEPQLSNLRQELRNSIDILAANPGERSREDRTRSRLNACCFSLKTIVESVNQDRAPVLLVFDTFEIVQYDDAAVAGVTNLIATLRAPKPENQEQHAAPWTNLRIVVAGRAGAPELATSQQPITLGPLPLAATARLIARRNETDRIGLTKPQISALAKPLRGSPLDVTIVMNWLKEREPSERANLLDEIIQDLKDGPSEDGSQDGLLDSLRVTGILVNRMIKHLGSKEIEGLVVPGLVVRAITPEIIRHVMAPASGLIDKPDSLPKGAEKRLFDLLARERWLVNAAGDGVVRHRPEVRLAMLDLMRRRDRQKFEDANRIAADYFRERAVTSNDARAETIYHLLLGGDLNIEEADRLWTPAVGPLLAGAVVDLRGLAQIYLKARLGRSVGMQALQTLPTSVQLGVLVSFGKRFLQRGLIAGLKDVIDGVQQSEKNPPELLGLQWETLYRSGRWRALRDTAGWQLSSGVLAQAIEALRASNFDTARTIDEQAGSPLRFALRLATRDPQMAEQTLKAGFALPDLDIGHASKLNEPFWDLSAFVIHSAVSFPDFGHRELSRRLMDTITVMSAQNRRLPAAATTSGALRVLVFHDDQPERGIMRRLDFESYFSTVCGLELQGLQKALAATLDDRDLKGAPAPLHDLRALADDFLNQTSSYAITSVIADSSLTRQFATVARAIVETGSQRGAVGILRILALTHPDWLEPLGHALTRAFDGKVPSQSTWWSSVESYFGSSKPRWRGRELSDGHEILALADEAGSLPEAITAYSKLVDRRSARSSDFVELVDAFGKWQAMLAKAVEGTHPTPYAA